MPSFRRSRRRFRRRSGGRRSLRRFARRIARAGTEPKRFENGQFLTDIAQGDGTSPQVFIRNIPSNLEQGDADDNFHGNSVYLKGLGIRIAASTFDALANFSTVKIRYSLIFSRTNATNMLNDGAIYNSTTTDNTNPAQATPFANPRLFDINATPGRFVGTGLETFYDRTNLKVIASKMFTVNVGGAGAGLTSKKLYFKINKTHQFQNPDASALTAAPNHGRFGSYYLITQVFTPPGVATPGDDTVLGTLSDTWHLYFRDP